MSEFDIEEVKQIEKECKISPWSLLDYREELGRKDKLAYVVKEQNQVVGFVLARLIINTCPGIQLNRKPLSLGKKIRNLETEIEIYNIAVKPNFQRQLIGQSLLNQLLSHTANIQSRSFWLEVRESNIRAIKFYEKNGFKKIFKRKNFYRDPVEHGVIMKNSY